MTQKVRIEFSSPGLKAPVYVAGSLGDQPWQPIEMNHTQKDDGELEFWKDFDAQEGEHQYKFRLGPGDWWVLDETRDIVDDGAGNRNNLLVVKPQAQAAEKKPSVATSTLGDAAAPVEEPQHSANILGAPDEAAPNLFTHETFSGESIQPLLKHESMKPSALNTTPVPVQSGNLSGKDQEYETDQDELASPLFRHESLGAQHSASSEDECASPLFRHESLSSTNSPKRRRSVRSSSASSHRSQAFGDENVSDHVLERFPTEMDSIIDQLHRASSRLPEDETDVDGLAPSPTLSQHGFESTTSPSFVASRENTDHLGSIDEDEDEELSPDEDNELPVPETAVPFETTEPGLNSPKLALSTSQPGTSHGQITPPMTPIDESQGSDELHGGSDDGSTNLKVPENIGSSTKSSSDDRDVIAKPASFWEWMGTFCGGRVGSVFTVAVGVAAAFYAMLARK